MPPRRIIVTLSLSALVGCEALVLDVGRRVSGDDASVTAERDAGTAEAPASVCLKPCQGGRRCERGVCLPHWLPIFASEGINDAPRVGHFTVWTGREVLVWGGRAPGASGESFGDGLRFDPASGAMRTMSRVDAPTARSQDGVTAVWTGQEMLVLGGRDGSALLRDAAGYSPALDRWRVLNAELGRRASLTAVSTGAEVFVLGQGSGGVEALRLLPGGAVASAAGPTTGSRAGHSALWTGAEVIVWGGADVSGAPRADGYRYVPTRARWRAVRDGGAASARRSHSAVWSSSEMLVFGGIGRDGRALAAPASYVPALDAWRALSSASAPTARHGHVAAWVGDAMLVWGGRDGTSTHADGAAYDPWDDVWQPLPALPSGLPRDGSAGGRVDAAAVWTGSELIVLGGENGGDRLDPYGWRYQP